MKKIAPLVLIVLVVVVEVWYLRPIEYQYTYSEKILPKSCCQISAENDLETLCLNKSTITSNCSCTDYMMYKLVMVTAISSNHFLESQDYFGSVHKNMPNTTIIVYDLGLKKEEVATLQSYCNVKVRRFNFSRYPSHVRSLNMYAWKVMVVSEMSEEFELFMYGDASCRVMKPLDSYLPLLMEFPFLSGSIMGYPMVIMTHEGMLKYLNLSMKRSELAKFHSTQAVYTMWVTEILKNKILSPMIDCALHKECIAPQGSKVSGSGCNIKGSFNKSGSYVGCHRYDQSALNMILIREFGAKLPAIFARQKHIGGSTINVERSISKKYTKDICRLSG